MSKTQAFWHGQHAVSARETWSESGVESKSLTDMYPWIYEHSFGFIKQFRQFYLICMDMQSLYPYCSVL